MNELRIRDARLSDQDTIREVTLAAYQEYATQMPAHWEGYRQNTLTTLAERSPPSKSSLSTMARSWALFYCIQPAPGLTIKGYRLNLESTTR
jgi:hypothetical protein